MAHNPPLAELGRRERQIMEILYELERATASEVHRRLQDPPSYSAVRAMLRLLEDKGHARHVTEGPRHVYSPTRGADDASLSAMRQLVKTFFRGSREAAMAALIESSETKMSDEERRRIVDLLNNGVKEG